MRYVWIPRTGEKLDSIWSQGEICIVWGGELNMEGYLSVADIVVLYETTPSYVYKMASLGQWRRRRLFRGKVEYYIGDVDRDLGKSEDGVSVG